jgi:hypothetical protein
MPFRQRSPKQSGTGCSMNRGKARASVSTCCGLIAKSGAMIRARLLLRIDFRAPGLLLVAPVAPRREIDPYEWHSETRGHTVTRKFTRKYSAAELFRVNFPVQVGHPQAHICAEDLLRHCQSLLQVPAPREPAASSALHAQTSLSTWQP